MRTVKITQTGVGASAPVVVDCTGVPSEISWAVNTKGAPATYSIQYTPDDVFNIPSADVVWFNDPNGTSLTANAINVIKMPVRAVRLSVASGAAAGVDFTINQGVAR